jgi:hypothetical protein
MEAIMRRMAFGVLALGIAVSMGTIEATAECSAHNNTVVQTNPVTQRPASQQALSTVPVATTSSTRDSGSGTAKQ